jgi:peptidoglycan/xylan/chitin deacetylase (PgdA/CDA1 family)
VVELPSDPQLLSVTPLHFAEHLEILKNRARPMRLQQLAQAIQDGNLPRRAVVVTFDDGYGDNLLNARPLLARFDIPATVFVTTGYMEREREFWWDELDRLLLQSGKLPESLHLSINGSTCQWELGDTTHYGEEDFLRHRGWNVLHKDDPTPRQRLYRSLCRLLRPLPDGGRRKVLDELFAWAGEEPLCRPSHRPLSPDEVLRLAAGGLVEVGAHTVTHPVLSALPADEQWAEVQGSKTSLEGILDCPVSSFAYPYGSRSDYTAETAGLVQESGFNLACSTFPGVVWRGADRFQLPRLLVRNGDGDEFACWLKGWLSG